MMGLEAIQMGEKEGLWLHMCLYRVSKAGNTVAYAICTHLDGQEEDVSWVTFCDIFFT